MKEGATTIPEGIPEAMKEGEPESKDPGEAHSKQSEQRQGQQAREVGDETQIKRSGQGQGHRGS